MVIRPKSRATVVVFLSGRPARLSRPDAGGAQRLLGEQRADLADRADQRGLAGAEAARDEDLVRGQHRVAGVIRGHEAH